MAKANKLYLGFDDIYGLNGHVQIAELTGRLTLVKVKDTDKMYDKNNFESIMLGSTNYKDFSDIQIHDQPQASLIFRKL